MTLHEVGNLWDLVLLGVAFIVIVLTIFSLLFGDMDE